MEKLNKLTWRIWESQGMGKALLIGGLIAYVPVINLLLFGYYGRWARQLILQEGMELPEWSDGRQLLAELGRVILPVLVWVIAPVALAVVLSGLCAKLLLWLHLGFFASTVALLPVAFVALCAPVAFMLSLIRLYRSESLREALDFQEILAAVPRHLRAALFPLFQFYGILALGWPLLGFAGFLATLPLMAQLVLIMRDTE